MKDMLNGVGENSIIISRCCPIDASVVPGVTVTSSNAELELKTDVDFISVSNQTN